MQYQGYSMYLLSVCPLVSYCVVAGLSVDVDKVQDEFLESSGHP